MRLFVDLFYLLQSHNNQSNAEQTSFHCLAHLLPFLKEEIEINLIALNSSF